MYVSVGCAYCSLLESENVQEATVVLGTELRLSGFHGKHCHPLSHLLAYGFDFVADNGNGATI